MAHALRDIVSAAANALHQDEDEDDFQTLINQTRRSFRRNTFSSPRRGRKPNPFKRKTLLLRKANSDYCPIKAECDMLTDCGLGFKDANFELNWLKEEIESYICQLYHSVPLELVGFKFAKMDRQKKLILVNIDNVESLKAKIGQSQLVIIPNRDLPLETPNRAPSLVSAVVPIEVTHQNVTNLPRRVSSTRLTATTHSTPIANTSTVITELFNDRDYLSSDINDNKDFCLPLIPQLEGDAETLTIKILRSNCVPEVFKLYADNEDITEKKLDVSFVGEYGVDGGGLTKELFNLFFKEIEHSFFQGEDCLIPHLPLNRVRTDKDKFCTIGKILEHMLLLTGCLPAKLSKVTLLLIADETKKIDNVTLVNEFQNFVNPCERAIIKKSLNSFSELTEKEKDVLSNMFHTYKFYELPKAQEIFEQISTISQNILVDLSLPFVNAIRKGINFAKYNRFWTNCDFETFLDIQKPTPSKVANSLKYDEVLSNDELTVLHFLEMYIRCLHEERIGQFVFLATGSYQMPDFIKVEFSKLIGLAQRPTFSTCCNSITVPSTYCTYQELKYDFDMCLNSEESVIYNSL